MFTCPNCNSEEAKRLIYPGNSNEFDKEAKLFCNLCYERKDYSPAYLHQYESQDGRTKVSWAKAEVIKNRIKSPDDKRTVIDRHTGRETQY